MVWADLCHILLLQLMLTHKAGFHLDDDVQAINIRQNTLTHTCYTVICMDIYKNTHKQHTHKPINTHTIED